MILRYSVTSNYGVLFSLDSIRQCLDEQVYMVAVCHARLLYKLGGKHRLPESDVDWLLSLDSHLDAKGTT